jgi:hypothetical protein
VLLRNKEEKLPMVTIEVLTENQRRRRWSAKRIKRDSGIGLFWVDQQAGVAAQETLSLAQAIPVGLKAIRVMFLWLDVRANKVYSSYIYLSGGQHVG